VLETKERLLDLGEIAELTKIPTNTIRFYRMRRTSVGALTFRVGSRVVARQSDVLAWIDAQARAEGVYA